MRCRRLALRPVAAGQRLLPRHDHLAAEPLVLYPGTFNSGFTAQQATAGYTINFQYIDIEYQVVAETTGQFSWGYLVGARYANLVQNFNVTYPFAPPDGTSTATTGINFNGVGPRAGLEAERILFPKCGFHEYETIELALYHQLGNLLQPEFTHEFC